MTTPAIGSLVSLTTTDPSARGLEEKYEFKGVGARVQHV